jgi:hypothetical protein
MTAAPHAPRDLVSHPPPRPLLSWADPLLSYGLSHSVSRGSRHARLANAALLPCARKAGQLKLDRPDRSMQPGISI